MDDSVKGSRRRRNAAATRARILTAAESLFVRDGYASTTITDVADSADVAVQTVYAVFGNKRALLTELLASAVTGDDGARPLRDRADWREMESELDPSRQLLLLARIATGIGNRMAALYGVLAGAAGSDPEMAEIYRQQQQERWHDQRRVARSLARRAALRPELTETQATDIMWALANPNTYRALVGERAWPTPEYEHLLAHLLTAALLEPAPRPTPAPRR